MMKKLFGYFFSILFLPLLLPLYATVFIVYSNPYAYPDPAQNAWLILRVGLLTFFFPAVAIMLMAALKFVKSVTLFERQERVIPYISAGFFYIWAFYVFYQEGFSQQVTFVLLGCTIAIFIDFLINILVLKISMHTTGAGGMIAFVMILMPLSFFNSLVIFLLTILIAGCIGSARLALKAHAEREVYYGYLVGFFSFLIAFNFYGVV
jgi:membrane-associated phospholipid phosphatase